MSTEPIARSQPRWARMPAQPPNSDALVNCLNGWLAAIQESATVIRNRVLASVDDATIDTLAELATRLRAIDLSLSELAELLPEPAEDHHGCPQSPQG